MGIAAPRIIRIAIGERTICRAIARRKQFPGGNRISVEACRIAELQKISQHFERAYSGVFADHLIRILKRFFPNRAAEHVKIHEAVDGQSGDRYQPTLSERQKFGPCAGNLYPGAIEKVLPIAAYRRGGINGQSPLMAIEEVALVRSSNRVAGLVGEEGAR